MYFDRFDICEAYSVYYSLWHSGITNRDRVKTKRTGYPEAITVQLHRMNFKPRSNLSLDTLNENALEIYNNLILKYEF